MPPTLTYLCAWRQAVAREETPELNANQVKERDLAEARVYFPDTPGEPPQPADAVLYQYLLSLWESSGGMPNGLTFIMVGA